MEELDNREKGRFYWMIHGFIFKWFGEKGERKMRKSVIRLGTAFGFVVMAGLLYIQRKEADENGRKLEKFKRYYQVLNKWIKNDNKQITNEMLIKNMGYSTIAIYGNGEIGSRLIETLINTSIEIKCVIEKKANDIQMENESGIKVVGIDDISEYSQVDVIIVTPVFDYENIASELSKTGCRAEIISIEDLVFTNL